ncbi:N-alpha-acetyltransferase 10/11 [Nematocida homosporus]|uniref:N-alpha-acetyltransferase 10/11 n=1 Tax=Nematocida homosporus TaxID=1912981 RepID=UPI00221F64E1|nr:N-alpha-acetyltransferase 10/11 [Nematocida homosporus]KAI5185651.1 N-alpha-acetyltransferase 10/11 [Nematocida homosporus]
MVHIRPMTISDMQSVKECNRRNLPENYHYIFFMYVIISAQGGCFVAENSAKEVIGYVIAKPQDSLEGKEPPFGEYCGYITSIAVDQAYRGRGLGKTLLSVAIHGLCRVIGERKEATSVLMCLNVRESNNRAIEMYKNSFGFMVKQTEPEYYPDKEASLFMTRVFSLHGDAGPRVTTQ